MEDVYVPTHFIRFNRPLRAILIDDQPWFVARDFGFMLGRRNPENRNLRRWLTQDAFQPPDR